MINMGLDDYKHHRTVESHFELYERGVGISVVVGHKFLLLQRRGA